MNLEKLKDLIPKGKKQRIILLVVVGGVAITALYMGSKPQTVESELYQPAGGGGYPDALNPEQMTGIADPYAFSDDFLGAIEDAFLEQEQRDQAQQEYMDTIIGKVEQSQDRMTELEDTLAPLRLHREQTETDLMQMQQNSENWYLASDAERQRLQQANQAIGQKLGLTYNPATGSWLDQRGAIAYTVDTQKLSSETVISPSNLPSSKSDVLARMQQNSEIWHKSSVSERQRLEQENQFLGNSLGLSYDRESGRWSDGSTPKITDTKQSLPGSSKATPSNPSKSSGSNVGTSSGSNSSVEKQMAANSAAWHKADAGEKKKLEQANQKLGSQIGKTYNKTKGTWS